MCKKCDAELNRMVKLAGLTESNEPKDDKPSSFTGFSDLEDMDSFWNNTPSTKSTTTDVLPRSTSITKKDPSEYFKSFTEVCKACNGTGYFTSWSGRTVGQCFKCKGKGKLQYSTSPEQRQKSKEYNIKRKANKIETFKADYPEIYSWLEANKDRSDFANSLYQQVQTRGELSDRQIEVIQNKLPPKPVEGQPSPLDTFKEQYPTEYNWIESKKDTNDFAKSLYNQIASKGGLSDKQLAAIQRQIPSSNHEIKSKTVEIAFQTAKENGIKRPKMHLEKFKLTLAPEGSVNQGAIYVKSREDSSYLGKIMDGKFYKSRDCSDEIASKVIDVMNDPFKEASAFGQKTGRCSFCGKELVQKVSVATNIGPICADKYGIDRSMLMKTESINEGLDFMLFYRLSCIGKILSNV